MLEYEDITGRIIGSALDVHRELRPGFLESAYEACLIQELTERGLECERQVPLPVTYKGKKVDCGYRLDLVVANSVIVELKCVDKIIPGYESQLLTNLRLSGKRLGLLIDFNMPVLKSGVVRRIL